MSAHNERLVGQLDRRVGLHYTTQSGDSVMGIALRQLRNADRWKEIVAANSEKYPEMGPHDYYPVGTRLVLPNAQANRKTGHD